MMLLGSTIVIDGETFVKLDSKRIIHRDGMHLVRFGREVATESDMKANRAHGNLVAGVLIVAWLAVCSVGMNYFVLPSF